MNKNYRDYSLQNLKNVVSAQNSIKAELLLQIEKMKEKKDSFIKE
jgi:hypothetical protein